MTIYKTALIGAVLIAACAAPSTALAQFATNSTAPATGSADKAVFGPGRAVFTGQVDIRQDDVRVLSDEMTVISADRNRVSSANEAFDDVDRIEAIGNFFYITPDQEVTGAQGIYEAAQDSFTVTGDVILLQGQDNVVTGDRLVYNLSTNQAVVTGTCQGRRCGSKGRVNILIKNTNNSAANGAAN